MWIVESLPKVLTLDLSSEVSLRSLCPGECPTDLQMARRTSRICGGLGQATDHMGIGSSHFTSVCTYPNMSYLCHKDPS